ncbi:ABC transporter permease [Microbacterium resistens]|uniref:ABC transporter permease n=1 Tax=Microbacterium resistens TaxID=156977 RepID=UPI001C55F2F0|nr:ABC transporter permease [Microbacterium resistens]MBW1638092.1 ABC transporter permease [Microbacterium resistens]
MLTYILRKLGSGLVLLLTIAVITFGLLSISARNAARSILGTNATPEQVAAKEVELGLDRPVAVRFIDWLLHAVQGDLGYSWFASQTVVESLSVRVPITLTIVISVTLVSAVLSFALGLAAGVWRGWLDRLVQVIAVIGYALPGFIIALFLVTVFAVQWGWFPATGYTPPTSSVSGWVLSVTLPVAALSIGAVSATAQQVRSATIDVLRQDFVRTLRARGLPEERVVLGHVVRNASAPALTVLALQFVGLLGGAVVIEQIFAIPGLGSIAVTSTSQGDVPLVMGLVMVTVLFVILVNLLVDIAVGWLNPKARVA